MCVVCAWCARKRGTGRRLQAMTRKERELEGLLTPTVRALGCEIWGIEYRPRGRNSMLKLYIDSPEGIGIDDCERVSRQVRALLDVEDPIGHSYRLEVSSPGIDRVLFRREQYAANVGERVDVRLAFPFDGRRRFAGRLTGIEGNDVVVEVEDHEVVLPFEQIQRTRLVSDGVTS